MIEDNSKFKIQNSKLEPENQRPKAKKQSLEISTAVKKRVKRLMWERVGILRDKTSLQRALRELEQISKADLGTSSRNFVTVARLVTQAALWREESRGGHFRTDFPQRDDANWRVHSIQKRDTEITGSEKINFAAKAKV